MLRCSHFESPQVSITSKTLQRNPLSSSEHIYYGQQCA
jgi:hypothetical protein